MPSHVLIRVDLWQVCGPVVGWCRERQRLRDVMSMISRVGHSFRVELW